MHRVRALLFNVFFYLCMAAAQAQTPLIEDDFTHTAGDMPADSTTGQGGPMQLPAGSYWTNYQNSDRVPNHYDGGTQLQMPRVNTWNQYIDSRLVSLSLNAVQPYAFVTVFTMPDGAGTEVMGFAADPSWNTVTNTSTRHRVFKLS